MGDYLEIIKFMKPSEKVLKRFLERKVDEPHKIEAVEGIYTQNGVARAFNVKQYLRVRTGEKKHFEDYGGNVIERKFNCKDIFKFIGDLNFKPDIKVRVEREDFIAVLREMDARQRLYFYMGCNDELDKLIFYIILDGEKIIIAEVKLDEPIQEKFDDLIIHNHRNIYEILLEQSTKLITIHIDSQRDLITFYIGRVELLMGCNSKNFELG